MDLLAVAAQGLGHGLTAYVLVARGNRPERNEEVRPLGYDRFWV
jgi:hypothetical protein